ncbi:MAG: hypothetical protein K0S68_281 [Candidatus Saccharibacteria bacterium]|jgi:hypothetical protein|nr:hypothetical protein [Candidatus Saccharibacteria bacterium]
MSTDAVATEPTKTDLENTVTWFLADKMQDASVSIATKKYLTNDNLLVYLTRCVVAEASVPKIKVQILKRIEGGVHETGYQLFSDHRLTKYVNEMVFGTQPAAGTNQENQEVSETEAVEVLTLVKALANARQTL